MQEAQHTPYKRTNDRKPHLDFESYKALYGASIQEPEAFWGEQGKVLDWIKPYQTVKDTSYEKDDFRIRWYADGTLNVCVNCVDRHLPEKGDQTALLWEGNDSENTQSITYNTLYKHVCRYANGLKKLGITKGDPVIIYMPMIPEAVMMMLACARIGAVHSVVFGGFSAASLASRIDDCEAKLVVTATCAVRGEKVVPLKEIVDESLALSQGNTVEKTWVFPVEGHDGKVHKPQDVMVDDLLEGISDHCPAEEMNAEDLLFILYTSGSTGTPKGVLHTCGGYLVYASLTHKYIFDYHDGDVYWCTADIGWITGHTYVVYGPLANGATTFLYEGVPAYPNASRMWEMVDRHQINILYTAPTLIRALMKEGDQYLETTSRDSLKVLGSVGEPLNVEAWEWYFLKVGKSQCPVVDTWWQTETGGIMITPLPGFQNFKPGSVAYPFFGIQPTLVDKDGMEVMRAGAGSLVITDSWPGQMRGVYKKPQLFFETYFSTFKNVYTSGDGAKRDRDGYFWISGRVDDVMNISGHRLGTAEVENAINLHEKISESAVVGIPHDVKGEGIVAFVMLKTGEDHHETLEQELIRLIRQQIGPIATPERIIVTPGLPKTRSGKIMRRILRKLANNETDQVGDISTLSDPAVVKTIETLIAA